MEEEDFEGRGATNGKRKKPTDEDVERGLWIPDPKEAVLKRIFAAAVVGWQPQSAAGHLSFFRARQ